MKKDHWLIGISAAAGIAVWAAISMASHKREAWDSELYFIYAIPFICVVAAVLAVVQPNQAWRWAVIPFAAQALWMILTQGIGNMLPLGLMVFGLFSIPALLTTLLGAYIGRKIINRAST